MYYCILILLSSSFFMQCGSAVRLVVGRMHALAALSGKRYEHRRFSQGFLGLGALWGSSQLANLSSEEEKEVVHKIENTSEDTLSSLHGYAKKYSSYAPIRNALLQKSLLCNDGVKSEHKRNFIKYLIKNIDCTCDPQAIVCWVVQIQESMPYSHHADIFDAICRKQILSKTWREIMQKGVGAVLDVLSEQNADALIASMDYEDTLSLVLHVAFEGKSLDNQLNFVVEKFREKMYTKIVQSDVNTYIKKVLLQEILQEHLTWEQCISVHMRLHIRNEPSALNKFVMSSVEHKKVDLIEKLLLYVHKWEGNLSYCLSSRVFSRLVDFVKIHQHTMPWAVYNAIATSPELASMVIQRLKNCRLAAGIATIFEIIDHCPAIIENSERLRNYIVDFLITHKSEIHTLDPQCYGYLLTSKLGNDICERIIVANDADSLIWFTERFPKMLCCIEHCAHPHIVSFFEKHHKILLYDTTLFRMAVLRNQHTLEQEIRKLIKNNSSATLNFDISKELRLEVYNNMWRVNWKLWDEFATWIKQTNRLEKEFIDTISWNREAVLRYPKFALKNLNSLPVRCRHHSNGLCEYCVSMHNYYKEHFYKELREYGLFINEMMGP